MSNIAPMPPMRDVASGVSRATSTYGDVPNSGFWGNGRTRYGTVRTVERVPVHLSVEASPMAKSKLDQAVLDVARGRAREAGRAVAIVDAADGMLATRTVALNHGMTYNSGSPSTIWASNVVRGNHSHQLLMKDKSVRAIVNASDGAAFGARPYASRIANTAFGATRWRAFGIAASTLAASGLAYAAMSRDDSKGRSLMRGAAFGTAIPAGIVGGALMAGAIAGRGNPVHSTRWIGIGGAAMAATSTASLGLLASDRH